LELIAQPAFSFYGNHFLMPENDIPNKDIAKTAPAFLLMA
jgi:hypothetical protein